MTTTHIWNVTTKVSRSVHPEWLIWLKTVHIPAYLETGCFFNAVILRLVEQDGMDDFTYAVQFHASSALDYARFYESFFPGLRNDMLVTWGNDCLGFNTLLEVVN